MNMLMLYFSGTGNSKYIAELFSHSMNVDCHSIEESIDLSALIAQNDIIAFCYPVYMSRVPRIMREFAIRYMKPLEGKKIIIFCTQLILSGDGARAFAALFPRRYVDIIYAEHFFMPNNVSNMAFLPMTSDKVMKKYALRAQRKMQAACENTKAGKVKKCGFNALSRFLGLFQAVLLGTVENRANNSVKISDACTKCGICVKVCPMNNLVLETDALTHKHNCTICYRCINKCPHGAITIFWHGRVKKQYSWRET